MFYPTQALTPGGTAPSSSSFMCQSWY